MNYGYQPVYQQLQDARLPQEQQQVPFYNQVVPQMYQSQQLAACQMKSEGEQKPQIPYEQQNYYNNASNYPQHHQSYLPPFFNPVHGQNYSHQLPPPPFHPFHHLPPFLPPIQHKESVSNASNASLSPALSNSYSNEHLQTIRAEASPKNRPVINVQQVIKIVDNPQLSPVEVQSNFSQNYYPQAQSALGGPSTSSSISSGYQNEQYRVQVSPNFLQTAPSSSMEYQPSSTVNSNQNNAKFVLKRQNEIFPCRLCGKDFATPYRLRQHQATQKHRKLLEKSQIFLPLASPNTVNTLKPEGECDDFFKVEIIDIQNLNAVDSGNSATTALQNEELDTELLSIEPADFGSFINEKSPDDYSILSTAMPSGSIESIQMTNEELRCNLCNKTFAKKCYFTQHFKQMHHNGEKQFKCRKCGKCFSEDKALQEHIKRHYMVSKPFKCNQCTKSFIHKTDLKRHEILHSSGMPHVCHLCSKGFARNDHLAKHIKTHEKRMQKMQKFRN
jgi:hypothetical protein